MQDPARRGSLPAGARPQRGPRAGNLRRNSLRVLRGSLVTAVTFAVGLSHDGRAGAAAPLIGPVPVTGTPLIGPVPLTATPLIGPVPLAPAPRLIGPIPIAAPAQPAAPVPAVVPAIDTSSPKSRARAAALSRLRVVAHRGGTVWGPESTLTTFDHALDIGADALEFDVHFTKDDVPVVLHDPTLQRTTDCQGPVAAMTLAKVKQCDAGRWYKPNPIENEEIPTLAEALNLLDSTGTHVYVHVKVASAGQAKTIVKVLNEYGMNRTASADNPATVMADSRTILANLKAAGAKRLGYVFHDPSGWGTNYPVLVPIDVPMTRALVAKAQHKGQYVTLVQGTSALTLNKLADLGLDAFMVNDPDDLLSQLGRVDGDEGLGGYGREGVVDGRDGRAGGDDS